VGGASWRRSCGRRLGRLSVVGLRFDVRRARGFWALRAVPGVRD